MLSLVALLVAGDQIFDGKTLNGWEIVGGGKWTVEAGVLKGQCGKGDEQGVLLYGKPVRDFTAKLQFRISEGNSGFYFRTHPDEKGLMHGIQAEIDATKDDGGFYESYGRNWLSQPKPEAVASYYKPKEWNEMKVEAIGNRVTSWINGVKAAEITDDKQRSEGVCALQIHGGQDVHVMFKDIKIEDLGDSQ